MEIHEKYMKRCLELASEAKGRGKTAVGSLIVCNGKIVGEGIEGDESLPGVLSHAENLAVLKAMETLNTKDLSDCVLYTTVEPCFMCTYIIRQMKVGIVIYGTDAGSTGGAGSDYPILTAVDIDKWLQTPKVIRGVMEKECREVLLRN